MSKIGSAMGMEHAEEEGSSKHKTLVYRKIPDISPPQWLFPGRNDLPMNGQKLLRQGFFPAAKKAGLISDSCTKIPPGSISCFMICGTR
jgi:hypothetical protein